MGMSTFVARMCSEALSWTHPPSWTDTVKIGPCGPELIWLYDLQKENAFNFKSVSDLSCLVGNNLTTFDENIALMFIPTCTKNKLCKL